MPLNTSPQFPPAHGCGRASTRIYGARLGQRARRTDQYACTLCLSRALASRPGEKSGLDSRPKTSPLLKSHRLSTHGIAGIILTHSTKANGDSVLLVCCDDIPRTEKVLSKELFQLRAYWLVL